MNSMWLEQRCRNISFGGKSAEGKVIQAGTCQRWGFPTASSRSLVRKILNKNDLRNGDGLAQTFLAVFLQWRDDKIEECNPIVVGTSAGSGLNIHDHCFIDLHVAQSWSSHKHVRSVSAHISSTSPASDEIRGISGPHLQPLHFKTSAVSFPHVTEN